MSNSGTNKFICALAYVGILVIVPLVVDSNNPDYRFHANQGIILLICGFVIGVLSNMPFIGFIASLGGIVIFVLAIMGIINAINGEQKELPIIGQFKLLK